MLFTPIDLARRIEHAERDLLVEGAESVCTRRPDQTVEVMRVARGAAVFTGTGSPLNKLFGLGFAGDGHSGVPTEAELDAIEAMCFGHGIPVQAEVSSLANPGVVRLLTDRGYGLVGFENVSGLLLEPGRIPEPDPGIAIRSGEAVDVDVWLDTVVTGFGTPDAQGVEAHEEFPRDVLEQVVLDFTSARGVVRYVGSVEDQGSWRVAGAGSLRVTDGVLQLCGAATLPDLRRRGVQTALLHRRLRDGVEAGCDVAAVTTQPGSKSQQNMHRQGFEILYVRAILLKEPPPG